MQQKFNLEAAGRLLGISSSAMRARAKKNPEKYRLERDNRGQIWVWIDPETLPELKSIMQPAKDVAVKAQPDDLKAALQAIRDHAEAAVSAADLQAQIAALRDNLAKMEQLVAVAEAEKRAAQALADERMRALDAAERNLADLRRLLPTAPRIDGLRPWWRFWAQPK